MRPPTANQLRAVVEAIEPFDNLHLGGTYGPPVKRPTPFYFAEVIEWQGRHVIRIVYVTGNGSGWCAAEPPWGSGLDLPGIEDAMTRALANCEKLHAPGPRASAESTPPEWKSVGSLEMDGDDCSVRDLVHRCRDKNAVIEAELGVHWLLAAIARGAVQAEAGGCEAYADKTLREIVQLATTEIDFYDT